MIKQLAKTLFFGAMVTTLAFPAPFVHAAVAERDAINTVIQNMANAESVDFTARVNVEADAEQSPRPFTAQMTVNGTTDFTQKSAYDIGFLATESAGATHAAGGAMILVGNTMYVSEAGGAWYSLDMGKALPMPKDAAERMSELEQSAVADVQGVMNDLIARGVITYSFKGLERMNGTLAARYAYTVDMQRFADYLAHSEGLSASETETLRDAISTNVSVGGNIWIDTVAMLPAKFTLNVNVTPDATTYTRVSTTVDIHHFNKAIQVSAPKNATPLADADMRRAETSMRLSMTSMVGGMDSDGDGLTNGEETKIWYSNPLDSDSDGDGYPDYTEVVNGYDPNGVGKLDSDGDSLTDYAEMTIHWTDRFNPDSDGDSYHDGVEIANGYNPNGPGRF